jgi:flagellar protein FlbD
LPGRFFLIFRRNFSGFFGNLLIHLSRLNGADFVLNSELIEQVEATPETVVTLTSGKKITVRETPQEIVGRFLDFKRRIAFPPSVGAAVREA